jgi:hypothetical protein
MIGSLLTFFAVGLVTLLVAGVVLSVVGVMFSLTFGLAAFLLFKVAPILLVGWIVVKVIEKSRARTRPWALRVPGPHHRRIEGDAAQERHAHLLGERLAPPPLPKTSTTSSQCGQAKPLMFSTMPRTRVFTRSNILMPRRTSPVATPAASSP